MKVIVVIIKSHQPGNSETKFSFRTLAQSQQVGVPTPGTTVVSFNALLNLQQRVLYVARILFISEVFSDVGIGESATEPREIPG